MLEPEEATKESDPSPPQPAAPTAEDLETQAFDSLIQRLIDPFVFSVGRDPVFFRPLRHPWGAGSSPAPSSHSV